MGCSGFEGVCRNLQGHQRGAGAPKGGAKGGAPNRKGRQKGVHMSIMVQGGAFAGPCACVPADL